MVSDPTHTQHGDTKGFSVFKEIKDRSNKDTVICIKSTIHPEALTNVINSTKSVSSDAPRSFPVSLKLILSR